MSGGHYDYAFTKVNDVADQIDSEADAYDNGAETVKRDPGEADMRREIAAYLRKVSEAMRALEWCDSGDTNWFDNVEHWITLGVLDPFIKRRGFVKCPCCVAFGFGVCPICGYPHNKKQMADFPHAKPYGYVPKDLASAYTLVFHDAKIKHDPGSDHGYSEMVKLREDYYSK